jgi:hypothetical protein
MSGDFITGNGARTNNNAAVIPLFIFSFLDALRMASKRQIKQLKSSHFGFFPNDSDVTIMQKNSRVISLHLVCRVFASFMLNMKPFLNPRQLSMVHEYRLKILI